MKKTLIIFLITASALAMERDIPSQMPNMLSKEMQLIESIKSADFDGVKALVESGVRVDLLVNNDRKKLSTLHLAAKSGNLPLFKYLCERSTALSWSVVDSALESGNLEVIKYAYKKCSHIVGENQSHLLRNAARTGNEAIYNFFKKKFPRLESHCRELLHAVAQGGNTKLFDTVYHAAPTQLKLARIFERDNFNRTVFHYAVWSKSLEMFNYIYTLLVNNRSFDAEFFKAKNHKGCTILHSAVDLQYIELVQRILQIDSSLLEDTENLGRSSLEIAASRGNLKIFKMILGYEGATALLRNTCRFENLRSTDNFFGKITDTQFSITGFTLLHSAAIGGNHELFTFVYSLIPDMLCQRASDGTSVLFMAAMSGNTLLFEYVYDLDTTQLTYDQEKIIPSCLYVAAALGNLALFNCIKEKKPELAKPPYNLLLPHYAARGSNLEIFKSVEDDRLIKIQCDGRPLLHTTCMGNKSQALNELFFYIAAKYPFLIAQLANSPYAKPTLFEEALRTGNDEITLFLCKQLNKDKPFDVSLFKEALLSHDRHKSTLIEEFVKMSHDAYAQARFDHQNTMTVSSTTTSQ